MVLPERKTIQRLLLGRSSEWIKRFNVEDYRDTPQMIEKLYEEKQLALLEVADLREQVRTMQEEIQALKLNNQAYRQRVSYITRQSSHMFILSLLAAVLLGLGVNVATDNPHEWLGWVVIISACFIELIVFMMKPREQ